MRYAGYCYDTWSQDYYLQARYYDPATKQFISKDPARADGEASAYQYCSGDPIHQVDPTGLWGWGGLSRAFSAVRQRVSSYVSRASSWARSTASRVYASVRRAAAHAAAAARSARARIARRAAQVRRAASAARQRVRNRIAAMRAAAQRRAAQARAWAVRQRASAAAKSAAKERRAAALRAGAKKTAREEQEADARRLASTVLSVGSAALGIAATGVLLCNPVGAGVVVTVGVLTAASMTMTMLGMGVAKNQHEYGELSDNDYNLTLGLGYASIGFGCLGGISGMAGVADDAVLASKALFGMRGAGVGLSSAGMSVADQLR